MSGRVDFDDVDDDDVWVDFDVFFHVDDDLSDVCVTIFNPLILFFVLWGTEVTEEELVSGTNEDVELQGLPATASWLLQRLPYQPQAAFASGG